MKEEKRNKAENKRYTKVGPYILTEQIGKGAYSVVYGAKKQGEKNRYAVKQISLANLKPRHLQRIHSQINVLTNIKHKNIINLVDYKQTSRNLYLIFEFCKHTDLDVYTNKYCGGKMPEEKVRKIGIQIKKAFQVLRHHKIVHRDLKLANILITEDFQIKIADFGFARHLDDNQFFKSYVGTPLTMAPEILENNPTYNEKCDLWSLGIIFYELLFGKNPFFSKKSMSQLQIRNATNAQLKFPQAISQQAQDLLCKLIKKSPHDRISFQQFFKHPWLMQTDQISQLNEDLLEQSLRNQLKNSLMVTVRKKQQKQFLMKYAENLLSYEIIQNVKNSIQAKFMFWINLGKKIMGLTYENLKLSFLAIGVLVQNVQKFQKCLYTININQDKKIIFPKYEQLRKLQKWQMSEYTKRLPGFLQRSLAKMLSYLKQQQIKIQFTKQQQNMPISQLFLYELTSEFALHLQNQQQYDNLQTFVKIRPLIVAPHFNLRISSTIFNENTIDLLLKKVKLVIENNRMYKMCHGVFKLQTQYREEPEDRIYENFKEVLQ